MSEPRTNLDIGGWLHTQLGRMDEWANAEWAVPLLSEREVAATWVLRTLADPSVPGATAVLEAICAQHEAARVAAERKRRAWEGE